MNNYSPTGNRALEFCRHIFELSLLEHNFSAFKECLSDDFSWFDCFAGAVRHDKDVKSLGLFTPGEPGDYALIKQDFSVSSRGDALIVFGSLCLLPGAKDRGCETPLRFAVLLEPAGESFLVVHLHIAVLDSPGVISYPYFDNLSLLQQFLKLNEIIDSIFGGIEICRLDEYFTALYLSEGFLSLTGYTREEIETEFHSRHTALVYLSDLPLLYERIPLDLPVGSSFSVEYRIIRKDRTLLWVLDNGTVTEKNGERYVQCMLTDISKHKALEEELRLSKKRYEVALEQLDATMFEYNIVTGQLILFEDTANMYRVPKVVENGWETFIKRRIIEPGSAPQYKEMYRKIISGEPYAECFVNARDSEGVIHDFKLSLTTVYDSDGKPIRAIGVRNNISQMRRLQNEQQYGRTLALGKVFVCEANVSQDTLLYLNENWKRHINLSLYPAFSCAFRAIAERVLDTDYVNSFLGYFKLPYLLEQLELENSLVSFQYKRLDQSADEKKYAWYNGSINIIRDSHTGDIHLRFYTTNINEQKAKEHRAAEEQRLYESMISKAMVAYEVNITKNRVLTGHEFWDEAFGIRPTSNYCNMIREFSKKGAHPDDGAEFYESFVRENVLMSFDCGVREITCEYRKPDDNGEFRWVCCTLHMYEDPDTGDVKGFSYVEDIDERKRTELSLKYDAEHDKMTHLYNKSTTEELITSFLKGGDASERQHAFLMIDIDNFKHVNDNFGHLFGDVVLSEIAGKIRSTFRDYDIVGRIGGDEFCVFMKNVHSAGVAKAKAAELCEKLVRSYSQDGKSCEVSASIGIALYSYHGKNYEELYRHADKALYRSKKNGRNRYSI